MIFRRGRVLFALAALPGTLAIDQGGLGLPSFGAACAFGVLAGIGVNNRGDSKISGHVGVGEGGSITGLDSGSFTKGQYWVSQILAQRDVSEAFSYGMAAFANLEEGSVSRPEYEAGVYDYEDSLRISDVVTLHAPAHGVFIFRARNLISSAGTRVVLTGGAQAANVYWLLSGSATLGIETVFQGQILALGSVTLRPLVDFTGGIYSKAVITLNMVKITNGDACDGQLLTTPQKGTLEERLGVQFTPGANRALYRRTLKFWDDRMLEPDEGEEEVGLVLDEDNEAGEPGAREDLR